MSAKGYIPREEEVDIHGSVVSDAGGIAGVRNAWGQSLIHLNQIHKQIRHPQQFSAIRVGKGDSTVPSRGSHVFKHDGDESQVPIGQTHGGN